jgi:hypothetical protein
MSDRVKELINRLKLLASNPATQLEHLRQQGLPEGIDELALDFDAIAAAADYMLELGELKQNQCECIKKVLALLTRMSGQTNAKLWEPEALFSRPEWDEVRSAANECLRLLQASQ